jgi:hypothetical protein
VNRTLKRALATAAVSATAALAPAGAAHAETPATNTSSAPFTLTFVPPKVSRLVVVIGPVIIGGKVISPGVHVETAGVELPTLSVTLPGWSPPAG